MSDPFGGGFDPRLFENVPLFREMAKLMEYRGGPVKWALAAQTARGLAASVSEPKAIGPDTGEDFPAAVGVAELWLDPVTALPRVPGEDRTLTAEQWVERATTSEGLGRLVEPIAAGMGAAMTTALPEAMRGGPGEDAGAAAPVGRAMEALGAMLYGVQIGTIAGHLSGQLLGTYDLGIPTIDPTVVATVGGTAERFAAEYAFDARDFRFWLALREASHRRMFAGVPWLGERLAALVGAYAAAAEFDPEAMLGALGPGGLDPTAPEALRRALEDRERFEVQPTAAQQATLRELQALVAFIESYGDTVVRAAAEGRLTSIAQIEEAMVRRRASKGPGEQFLQQLVGLDLKPADVREGRAFCDAVLAARGQEGLDRVWQAPGHLPRPDELAEPSRWLVRMAAAELE